jgi:hypothetical protein
MTQLDRIGSAKRTLNRSAQYPYDGQQTPVKDWAHAAARGVLADLSDRRGIKWELDKVDQDVRAELTESLSGIIRVAADRPQCAAREQCAKEVEQEAERLREMSRKPFLSDADRERLCVRYMQLFDMAVQLRVP